jgi:NADP-dependent 3-hydroxy acid dehydrogenase YdfG
MSIDNKVVAITGASSGIGRAIAVHLAAAGAKVALGARREDALREVAAGIEAAGGQVGIFPVDVARREDVEALVAGAVKRFGRLDVIVNNAGVGPVSRFDALRVADWDAMIDVNLRGVLHGVAAALPVFQRQGGGHLINIVSTAGLRITPTMGVYAATKNAVRTLTEALRQEAGPAIRVSEVSPGMVATDFSDATPETEVREAMQAQIREVAISPEAIARAVAFIIDQPADVEIGSLVIRPTAQA